MNFLKLYVSSLALLSVLDIIWLKFLANKFFVSKLGDLMSPEPKLVFAVIFYVLYPFAIIYLSVNGSDTPVEAMFKGAVLGATTYATYELTNMTILKDWPAAIILPDIIWGAFVTALVSAVVYRFVA